MVKRAKGFEMVNFSFIIDLSTFVSKVFLALKILDFQNVLLTKVVHVYLIKGMNYAIYTI
jgi:hypothetical protein